MSTREILTIQLGHYANFVGTHWWNIQETNFSYDPENPSEINPDVLYREGEFQKLITFTPRLLIADLKGTLGYLSEEGNLTELVENTNERELLWDKQIDVTEQPSAVKSPFLRSLEQTNGTNDEIKFDLENETNKWVDYLIPRFHQRTVNVITEYEHGSTTQPFDLFPYGQSLWKTRKFSENFVDKIRAYIEECDLLQGFQVLIDADNGFAGLGSSCIEYLRDEYGKSIITWPVIDAASRDQSLSDYMKVINMALSWQHIGEHSSLFSPLCCGSTGWLTPGTPRIFDNITYKADVKYHTSALLATALDTLSLRYRHKKYPMSALSDLCADFNKMGRKAAAVSLTSPFPMVEKQDLIDVLDNLDGICPLTTLTPSCNIEMDNSVNSLALRGIPESRLKQPMKEGNEQMKKAAYRCSTVHEMLSFYLDCSYHNSATYLTTAAQGLRITDPYPKIFNDNITQYGNISEKSTSEDVKSIPVMAGLHTGKFIADMYESLHSKAKKIRSIKKFHAFRDSGLEEDEYYESVNNLLDCKENYEDHYI